jgi:hypothetical protein
VIPYQSNVLYSIHFLARITRRSFQSFTEQRSSNMPPKNVDIVFVIDASDSMKPCFSSLAKHLDCLLQPLQGYAFNIRFGVLTHSVGKSEDGSRVFDIRTLSGNTLNAIKAIYQPSSGFLDILQGDASRLFTSDPSRVKSFLESVDLSGDEHSLIALDIALDFPFGDLSTTRRVIALFSDEKIEDGLVIRTDLGKIPDLIEKIHARHMQLFAAIPLSEAAEQLAEADRSEIESVDGGDGLASVNFEQLFKQMAKSISVSSQQTAYEPTYKRAIFGQDGWVGGNGSFKGLR